MRELVRERLCRQESNSGYSGVSPEFMSVNRVEVRKSQAIVLITTAAGASQWMKVLWQ